MKRSTSKDLGLAGFVASGFSIAAGFFAGLVMIVAFADPRYLVRYVTLLVVGFGFILLVPLNALRTPKERGTKKPKLGLLRRLKSLKSRRRAKTVVPTRMWWKRKPGQAHNTPVGSSTVFQPSTFVRSPRKPIEP